MGLTSMAIRSVDLPTKACLDALEATQLDLASKMVDTQQSVHDLHATAIANKANNRHRQADKAIGDTQQHATTCSDSRTYATPCSDGWSYVTTCSDE